MNDLVLVSTDDHIVEPPDCPRRLSSKYADRAPRVIEVSKTNFQLGVRRSRAPSLTDRGDRRSRSR